MNFIDAVAIVIDLANGNVLEEDYADDEILKEDREEQIEAVEKVGALLALLRE